MSKSDKPAFFASRRQMLKAAAGCSMMTNTSLLSTVLNLQATKAIAGDHNPSDYKAIVCLFLFGGIDSYNVLAPYDGSGSGNVKESPSISGEYGDYYVVRGGIPYQDDNGETINDGGLALDKSTLTPISVGGGRNLGLHPGMIGDADPDAADPGVAGLYNTNKLAFVTNVGSLITPTTKADYQARANLPLGLFSHADLQRHWMTGVPDNRSQLTGWGGRMSDCLRQTNGELDASGAVRVSMNISIGGVNLYQAGQYVTPYAIGNNGATVVSDYNSNNIQNRIFSQATDSILGQTYNDLLADSFAKTHRGSIDAAIDFNNAIAGVDDIPDGMFANESLSNRFKTLAKVIGAAGRDGTLNQKRQVFFIAEGGWDNHNNVLTAQENKLPVVSRALTSFYRALEFLGVADKVVTFTASDFARTLGSNGQGSDHAWGGNQIVMGGGVNGGQVYGEYPASLAAGNELDLGRGRLIPTTSVDELAADLSLWFGLNDSDLDLVLPNYRNFDGPLGMFG